MKNIVILISGGGSNMAAIVNAAEREHWQDRHGARVAAVLSNKADAKGLLFARDRGIATGVVDHQAYASREAFDAALMAAIDAHQPAVVLLAGFMRILTPGFVAHYAGRLLNIHPSLLPAFPGLHTHQRAIEEGVRIHGCTVHFVTAQLDHGPVVSQAAVPVLDDDGYRRFSPSRVRRLYGDLGWRGERHMQHFQAARRGGGVWLKIRPLGIHDQLCGAAGQQMAVGNRHPARASGQRRAGGQQRQQIRADACGFAGGDGDHRQGCGHAYCSFR